MKFFNRYGVAIACIVFLGSVYLPFIISGGLIDDDWSAATPALTHPGILPTYQVLFSQYSNRPLASLLFSLASNAFGTAAFCWIILDLAVWLLALGIVAKILAVYVSKRAGILFFLFGALPAFSSTVMLSPAVMLMVSSSALFWALSLYALVRYIQGGKRIWQVGAYGFLVCSLFSYEATLPLFIITALAPLVFEKIIKNRTFDRTQIWRYIREYILPIVYALIIVLIYQKGIIPHFVTDISRLRFRGLVIIPAVLVKFFFMVIFDIPALLISGISRIGSIGLATLVPMLGALIFFCRKLGPKAPAQTDGRDQTNFLILMIFVLAVLGAAAMYIISGTIPTIHGYDNRGLIGFGIALAGVLAMLGEYGYRRNRALYYAVIGLLFLVAISFTLQRDNYIQTARIQSAIFADIAQKVQAERVPAGDTVFVNVPENLRDNYNNEVIFSDELDSTQAGIPLTKRRLDFGRAVIDGTDIVSDNFRAPIASSWYYQSDEDLNSSLIKIGDKTHLEQIIQGIQAQSPPNLPFDMFRTSAEWYITHINIPNLKPLYSQYLARWGFN